MSGRIDPTLAASAEAAAAGGPAELRRGPTPSGLGEGFESTIGSSRDLTHEKSNSIVSKIKYLVCLPSVMLYRTLVAVTRSIVKLLNLTLVIIPKFILKLLVNVAVRLLALIFSPFVFIFKMIAWPFQRKAVVSEADRIATAPREPSAKVVPHTPTPPAEEVVVPKADPIEALPVEKREEIPKPVEGMQIHQEITWRKRDGAIEEIRQAAPEEEKLEAARRAAARVARRPAPEVDPSSRVASRLDIAKPEPEPEEEVVDGLLYPRVPSDDAVRKSLDLEPQGTALEGEASKGSQAFSRPVSVDLELRKGLEEDVIRPLSAPLLGQQSVDGEAAAPAADHRPVLRPLTKSQVVDLLRANAEKKGNVQHVQAPEGEGEALEGDPSLENARDAFSEAPEAPADQLAVALIPTPPAAAEEEEEDSKKVAPAAAHKPVLVPLTRSQVVDWLLANQGKKDKKHDDVDFFLEDPREIGDELPEGDEVDEAPEGDDQSLENARGAFGETEVLEKPATTDDDEKDTSETFSRSASPDSTLEATAAKSDEDKEALGDAAAPAETADLLPANAETKKEEHVTDDAFLEDHIEGLSLQTRAPSPELEEEDEVVEGDQSLESSREASPDSILEDLATKSDHHDEEEVIKQNPAEESSVVKDKEEVLDEGDSASAAQ